MKQAQIPLEDVLTRAIQTDAKVFASIWAMARLCSALRKKGILTELEIDELFAPAQVLQSLPEEFRSTAFETIRELQNMTLGRGPSRH